MHSPLIWLVTCHDNSWYMYDYRDKWHGFVTKKHQTFIDTNGCQWIFMDFHRKKVLRSHGSFRLGLTLEETLLWILAICGNRARVICWKVMDVKSDFTLSSRDERCWQSCKSDRKYPFPDMMEIAFGCWCYVLLSGRVKKGNRVSGCKAMFVYFPAWPYGAVSQLKIK